MDEPTQRRGDRWAPVDCTAGRRLGCCSFCCYLLVRCDAPDAVEGVGAPKGFVDKAPDGACVHLDRTTGLCRIWRRRPRVCREYDCNGDFLLQIVLREGFSNVAELVRRAVQAYIPRETYLSVPYLDAGIRRASGRNVEVAR